MEPYQSLYFMSQKFITFFSCLYNIFDSSTKRFLHTLTSDSNSCPSRNHMHKTHYLFLQTNRFISSIITFCNPVFRSVAQSETKPPHSTKTLKHRDRQLLFLLFNTSINLATTEEEKFFISQRLHRRGPTFLRHYSSYIISRNFSYQKKVL